MLPGEGPLLRVGRHRMLQIFSHGEEVLDPGSNTHTHYERYLVVEAAVSGGLRQ